MLLRQGEVEYYAPEIFQNVIRQEVNQKPDSELRLSCGTSDTLILDLWFFVRRVIRVIHRCSAWRNDCLLKLERNLADVSDPGVALAKETCPTIRNISG